MMAESPKVIERINFREQVLAAILDAERGANEAKRMDEALSWANTCTCSNPGPGYPHEPGCGYEPGLIWHMAQALLVHVREDAAVMLMHKNRYTVCEGCGFDNQEERFAWPCAEVLGVARRNGVDVPNSILEDIE